MRAAMCICRLVRCALHRSVVTATVLVMVLYPCSADAAGGSSIYWGAYVSGTTYGSGYGNAPWDTQTWNLFESHAGKRVSILHWGQPWYTNTGWPHGYYPFVPDVMDSVRARGAIPMIDWGSWDLGKGVNQTAFSLRKIANGSVSSYGGQTFDRYVTRWAQSAKAWGHPFFLRFDWEMNGNWQFPWSAQLNGNSPANYVAAWRHVHDIFTRVGATNVTWAWCPNVSSPTTVPLWQLYPGDAYVDWICLDGYNKDPRSWETFAQTFSGSSYNGNHDSYKEITALAPTKPLMIGEWACREGGDGGKMKAQWILDALQTQIPLNYPRIKAVVWFNWNSDPGSSYPIESSSQAQSAFSTGISAPYYTANSYSQLDAAPIPPPA